MYFYSVVKNLLIILTVTMFGYIQLYNGFVWMNYVINKSEIIEKFCVNKDKPEMKCHGTCHMKKMMLDEGKEDQSQPQLSLPEMLLFTAELPFEISNAVRTIRSPFFYKVNYNTGFLDEIDVPPKA